MQKPHNVQACDRLLVCEHVTCSKDQEQQAVCVFPMEGMCEQVKEVNEKLSS